VAHCDIKPQNVILTPDETAKVTDFGIARAYTSMLPEHSETVWGTPQYYAPEQAAGNPPTAQSDVYSIGILLFEMLAGRLPFESKDGRELARMHLNDEPPDLHRLNPNVSLQLESLVKRALAKDPAQRYRDANQFGKLLTAYLEQGREQTMGRSIAVPAAGREDTMAGAMQRPTGTGASAPTPRRIGDPAVSQPQRRVIDDGAPPPAAKQAAQAPAGKRIGSVGAPERIGTAGTSAVSASGTTGATGSTESRGFGNDIFLWLLFALAFLCVLGLLPLAYAVVTEYRRPPGALQQPTVAPTIPVTIVPPTPSVLLPGVTAQPKVSATTAISMPGLVGLSLEEAQRRLITGALQINVASETLDKAVTQTIVGDQRPMTGTVVQPGSVVDVLLRKPPPTQEVPVGLLGLTYDENLQRTLAGVGWTVILTEEFSTQPERVILGTEPRPGARLSVSGTLTLTVSSGGKQEIGAQFNDSIYLENIRLRKERFAPGETIDLEVRWRGTGRPQRIYNVAVFLLEGNRYAAVGQADDREPADNNQIVRTTTWANGTAVNDLYQIRTRSLPPGQYRLAIVMYNGNDRLPVINKGKALGVEFNSLLLRSIEIR
jgi:serine/threonine-protein kinase